jgi:hypothetical protein
MKPLLLLLLSVVLVGCQGNPYTNFYTEQVDPKTQPSVIPTTTPLVIYTSQDLNKDNDVMVRKGYGRIGYSSFNGAINNVTEDQLRDQAEKLGAAAVLVSSNYTHTIQGAMPLTLPSTTTSYTTGNATIYGSGGSANVYGNSTMTTYGTETTMIPYQVRRADFNAAYYVKVRQRVGMITGPTDDETRKRIGTNAGLLVQVVVDNTAAFSADVFAGDILVGANDERFSANEQYKAFLTAHEGQSAVFHLNRDGKMIDKTMHISGYKDPM